VEFDVRSTDPAFLEVVRGYLGEFRVDDAPDIRYRFSADCGEQRTLRGGMDIRGTLRLYTGTLLTYFGREQDEMAARLISQIRDRVYSETNDFVYLRAGGVVLDGGALVMPSPPEPRLPALVGMLVRAGAAYLGDEIVRVEPVLRRVHPIALPLLLRSDDLVHFPELDGQPTRRSRTPPQLRRTPVRPTSLGGTRAGPADPRWIVFPVFEPDGPTELRPMSGSEGVFGFAEAVLNLHVWADRALILAKELLANARVWRLQVGSLETAVELLTAELATTDPRQQEGDGDG
jgi:hypothetical protein